MSDIEKKMDKKLKIKTKPTAKDENKVFEERIKFVNSMKSPGVLYPHKFNVTSSISEIKSKYEHLKNDEVSTDSYTLSGRLMTKRGHGKLFFYSLDCDGNSLQAMCQANHFKPSPFKLITETKEELQQPFLTFKSLHKFILRGDIVGIEGFPCRTNRGELSLNTTSITILAPCLCPLPSQYYSLKDQELRYRNRHLDLIMNNSTKDIFKTRSKIITHFRNSLLDLDFLEVETPILAKIAGGATAKPFKTFMEDLKMNLYLRIAPELYLKELIIGNLDKVFEIGKNFRNEGVDPTHNPEFTSLELYWAYHDYKDGMKLVEDMLSSLVLKLKGTYIVEYDGKQIDFTPPFRRVSYLDAIAERAGFEMPTDLDSEETRLLLIEQCKKHSVKIPTPDTTAKLLDKLCGKFIEDDIISPVFVIEQPQIMSPLAKFHRERPGLTERFELFISGFEVANAYTELNNPMVQRQMFKEQTKQKNAGDEEIPPTDENFCKAMDYGMAPTCGIGIGIDRLNMILTDTKTIREVILFPILKDEVEKK